MRYRWRFAVAAALLAGALVVTAGPGGAARAADTLAPGLGASGEVATAADAGAALVALPPQARLLDTRTGIGAAPGAVAADGDVVLQVAGRGGVPGDAVAVALTVTATGASAAGYVTVWPAGVERPTASNLNVERAGQTIADGVVVPLGHDGQVQLHAQSSTDLVVDVTAYWRPAAGARGGRFAPVTPARVLDTRSGVGAPLRPLADGEVLEVPLAGRGGLPVDRSRRGGPHPDRHRHHRRGFVTAWPGGPRPRSRPSTSTTPAKTSRPP